MLLKAQFIGNLGAEATVRQQQNGDNAITFRVAVTEKRKDQDITTWINCTLWKRADQGTAIAQYLTKGQKVYIEGKPSVRAYQDQSGNTQASFDVMVNHVELLGGQQNQGAAPNQPSKQVHPHYAAPAQRQAPAPDPFAGADSNDDLPF